MMLKSVFRFKIDDRWWKFRWVRSIAVEGEPCYGVCDSKKRIISVCDGIDPKKELETIIHEVTHAQQDHLDEDYVKRYAKEQAELLWELGYRRLSDEQWEALCEHDLT